MKRTGSDTAEPTQPPRVEVTKALRLLHSRATQPVLPRRALNVSQSVSDVSQSMSDGTTSSVLPRSFQPEIHPAQPETPREKESGPGGKGRKLVRPRAGTTRAAVQAVRTLASSSSLPSLVTARHATRHAPELASMSQCQRDSKAAEAMAVAVAAAAAAEEAQKAEKQAWDLANREKAKAQAAAGRAAAAKAAAAAVADGEVAPAVCACAPGTLPAPPTLSALTPAQRARLDADSQARVGARLYRDTSDESTAPSMLDSEAALDPFPTFHSTPASEFDTVEIKLTYEHEEDGLSSADEIKVDNVEFVDITETETGQTFAPSQHSQPLAGAALTSRQALGNQAVKVAKPVVHTMSSESGFEASLPVGWETFCSESGRQYFYNPESKRTQWLPPLLRYQAANGRYYVYDPSTEKTSWDLPVDIEWQDLASIKNKTPPPPTGGRTGVQATAIPLETKSRSERAPGPCIPLCISYA